MIIRDRIVELDTQGVSTPNIAIRVGVTQSFVERVLDQDAGATTAAPITGTPRIAPAVLPVKKKRGRQRQPIVHGTHTGYQAHRSRGEEACAACKAGTAAYSRQRKAAREAAATRLTPAKPKLSPAGQQAIAQAEQVAS